LALQCSGRFSAPSKKKKKKEKALQHIGLIRVVGFTLGSKTKETHPQKVWEKLGALAWHDHFFAKSERFPLKKPMFKLRFESEVH
jgi:hypothetical protein